jgi:hypothetical protein
MFILTVIASVLSIFEIVWEIFGAISAGGLVADHPRAIAVEGVRIFVISSKKVKLLTAYIITMWVVPRIDG